MEENYFLNYYNYPKKYFENYGFKAEIFDLNENLPEEYEANKAYILIIKDGINCLLNKIDKNTNMFFEEQYSLDYDKKVYMYGRVCNKRARYNLCFSNEEQEPDYENKKGRIVSFKNVPLLSYIRNSLKDFLGNKGENLQAESNFYYDIKNCGIGFHGDSERKKVVGLRLGETIPLHYQWFKYSKPIGERIKFNIDHGDIYIMSEKATGNDWKKKKICTLRHAAGCKKFLK